MPSYETSQFSINNIPYGVASSVTRPSPQCVTRIGDQVIFLAELADEALFENCGSMHLESIFRQHTLNAFAALSKEVHALIRSAIQETYSQQKHSSHAEDISKIRLHLPMQIGDFTDFSASKNHVLNVPEAIYGTRVYPPAFHKYPVGYAGRCSSIVLSGSPITRPLGQYVEDNTVDQKDIIFGPCKALDYELEIGAFIGRPVSPNQGLNAKDADDHIFGLILVNDWSARDVQALEMNPLGPFNGKNFGTTISPWIITMEALKPHSVIAPPRMAPVAKFLDDPDAVNYNIGLTVDIVRNNQASRSCEVAFHTMYWTFRHMLAHHAIGGCGLRTGDLIASGTVSGEGAGEHGCLLELTKNGKQPWPMKDGSDLVYLHDGDEVLFTGAVGNPEDGIGFGECNGIIKSARSC